MAECRTNSPTNFCKSYPDARCVVYTGVRLPCINVNTNDRLEEILTKIDEKVCSSVGTGTVTSVAASITSGAISIAGSPITTSGTLAFTYTGTSAEYIAGDGSLVTFPSIPVITNEWHITGNLGTTAGTNFIGTIDDVDVVGKRNGIELLRIGSAGIGITNSTPTSKLHIKTDNIQTTQSDANGILLDNSTVGTLGVPSQMSPGISWRGHVFYNQFGGFDVPMDWRADVSPIYTVFGGNESYWQLSNRLPNTPFAIGSGQYIPVLRAKTYGDFEVLQNDGTNTTGYGTINSVYLGDNTNNIGSVYLWFGTKPTTLATYSGGDNISIGIPTMPQLTSGSYNIAIGYTAGYDMTTSNLNTLVGYQSGANITTGTGQNAFYGANSGLFVTTGFKNTFIGAGAGENTTIGQENTALGQDSGLNNTIGVYNVYVGVNAKGGAGGVGNIIIGYYTGASLVSSVLGDTTDNIFLGRNTGFNASQKIDAKNTIAIGAGIFTTLDNQMVLGNTSITETFIRGAKTTAPDYFYGELTNGSLTKRTPAEVLSDIGGTSAQTWQQTLTTGSTLTGNNTIAGGGFNLIFNDLLNFQVINASTGTVALKYNGGTVGVAVENLGAIIRTGIYSADSVRYFRVQNAATEIAGLTNLSTQDRIIGVQNSTGNIGNVTLGSGLSLSSGVLNTSGTVPTPISSLTAATGTNSIENTSYRQLWNWSNITNSQGLYLYSNNTTMTTGGAVFAVKTEGALSNSSVTSYGADITNSHTGTTGTNVALQVAASGGTNNYGLIVQSGSVGIGTSTPTSLLHVNGVAQIGTAGSTLGQILMSGNTSGTVTLQPAAAAGTWTLTLPTDDGAPGQFLQTDGSGITSWQTVASGITVGSTTVTSGTDTRVFFQDGSVVGQDSNFTFNKTTDVLTTVGMNVSTGTVGYQFGGTTRIFDDGSKMRISPTAGIMQMFTSGSNYNLQIYNSAGDSYFNFAPLSGTGSIFETVGSATNIKMQTTAAHTIMIGNGTAVAKTNILSTTEQLRLMYDASNYVAHTVSSVGVYTVAPTGASVTVTKPVVLKNYTVATLPTGVQGMICYVTDATAPTYGATLVGGGAVVTIAFFDGTNWTAH